MEKTIFTFNDLPEVVAQLRNEVMSLKSLLTEQRSVNHAKTVDTHVPMSVDEAAEYLGIPKGTLYMKLSEGIIPATKPGKRYCLYRDELDKWLETARKNPVPLSDEELYQPDTWRPHQSIPDAERHARQCRHDEHQDGKPDHS